MAIEWWVRVNRGFSMADLLDSVGGILGEIGVPGVGLSIKPADAVGVVIGSDRDDIDMRISTADGGHANTLSFQDFGDPDDPELGKWITVTSWRDNLSIVLSIATVIAAAKLTNAPVIDETQLLGGRQQDPDDLIEALKRHPVEQAASPADRARSLLNSFQPRLLIADR